MSHLQPHSAEWFERLRTLDPRQAAHTQKLIQLAGTPKCCGICGDIKGIRDYKLVSDPTMTVRFCDVCRDTQKDMHGLSVDPL